MSNPKSREEREAFIEKSRKKLQGFLNYGFIVKSSGKEYTSSNEVAKCLEQGETFALTIPPDDCVCLQSSEMGYKLLKPYLKDQLHIQQKSSKTHYLLFSAENKEQLEEIFSKPNSDLQLQNTFELQFTKYTLPTYSNTAKLYSVENAPFLTTKALNKIKEIFNKVTDANDTYFLLSNSISYTYNMPMTILRKLGENVISLKALTLLELILIYATNSSCLFRQQNDEVKPFIIPEDFFNLDDFKLNQSKEEISESLKELKMIGLINSYENLEDSFVIKSNTIGNSIKQYTYKQELHHYSDMGIQQRPYVYTFINYLRYVKNISRRIVSKDSLGVEKQKIEKAEVLTISFEGLLYNLELEDYIHDYARLATILDVLLMVGREYKLLLPQTKFQNINKNAAKYLLTHRDKLHEIFVLNPNEPQKEESKNTCGTAYFIMSDVNGRNIIQR